MDVEALADQAVDDVERLYLAAVRATDAAGRTADAARVGKLRSQITEWEYIKRAWAIQGETPAGLKYTWDQWFDLGKAFAGELAYLSQMASEYPSWKTTITDKVVDGADAVKKAAGDAADAAKKAVGDFIPWWGWVLLGVVAVGYLANGLKVFWPRKA